MSKLTYIYWMCLFVILMWMPITVANAQDEIAPYQEVAHLQFPTASDVQWSPSGTRLAVAANSSIHIIDPTTWDSVLDINSTGNQVSWSPDSTKVASVRGGDDESLFIWDADTGEILNHFIHPYDGPGKGYIGAYRLSWSPDGTKIATDSTFPRLMVWDLLDNGKTVIIEAQEPGRIAETDWSPDSSKLVSAGPDATARVWDAETGQQLLVVEGGGPVDWHPSEDKFLTGKYPGLVSIWDANSGDELLTVEHGDSILSVQWNSDGTLFATGGLDGIIKIWRVDSDEAISTINEHADLISALSWHPQQNLLASASLDGDVRVWQIDS